MKFNRVVLAAVATAGLIGSIYADEAPYCIAVGGGFGNGGSTFVARQFQLPAPNKCTPWAGYTLTSGTVVLTTGGTACVSDDGNVMTVGVTSYNPNWVTGNGADYIQFCLWDANCTSNDVSVENQPLAYNGIDLGFSAGSATVTQCTDSLLDLSPNHA